MKLYGWRQGIYSTCRCCKGTVSRETHMALKRSERFRAANDARVLDHVYGFEDCDLELPCCDSDCVACYGIDATDALDAFPLPPLTAPLVALALEAA